MRHAPIVMALLATCAMTLSCAAPSRTTRLQVSDFEIVAIEMAAKLRASPFLAGRAPDDPPITVALTKVENLSSDILSDGEKWYLVDRVIDSDAIAALRESYNIRFTIPAEKLKLLRRSMPAGADAAPQRAPTHALTARITSVIRAAGVNRTDLYDVQFSIIEIASGQIAWTDSVALKRIARGKAYD